MKDTPSMLQYRKMKESYGDCVLFFRMGDFYETFQDDAYITSRVLGITLTSRDKGEDKTPMAGIPYHALMQYLPKMVQAGYKVALCEQMEDPKKAKGIVKREVVKVITPGTVIESDMQNPRQAFYTLALCIDIKKHVFGIGYLDIAKGGFWIYQTNRASQLAEIIQNINPSEVVLSETMQEMLMVSPRDEVKSLSQAIRNVPISYVPSFDFEHGYSYLCTHFKTTSLKGFVQESNECAIKAAGALLKYVEDNQKSDMLHIEKIEELRFGDKMFLDPSTIANLELLPNTSYTRSQEALSLLDVLDKTKTVMGARLLRYSLLYPLIRADAITRRLESVSFLREHALVASIQKELEQIADIERINARMSFISATPRDFIALREALLHSIALMDQVTSLTLPPLLSDIMQQHTLREQAETIITKISKTISDDAGQLLDSGMVIKQGVNPDLDELKNLLVHGKSWIKEFQEAEIKRTGINSLKVRYNKVFGYYIEISHTHKSKVPADYIRKQTLVNAERYITQALKDKEEAILTAQDKILIIEAELFLAFKREMVVYVSSIKQLADDIAMLDMLTTFAFLADSYHYVQPVISDDTIRKPIRIVAGRHPIIERNIESMTYIPNDVYLDCVEHQILLITGPNMSGKSSILRMVVLISLMMQIGCFVPAEEAELALVDRIFSRVGARDNLTTGESTFMVEMHETANILHNATSESLIILDEIGRGTSTYDGVSIAYAVVEYIHEHIGAKTIFATHYHELVDMESLYKRVKNFNVLVKEMKDTIIFLRKLARGGTDKSYGIHVAKIAGVPKEILMRAENVLHEYEKIKEEIKKADIPPLLSLMGAEGASHGESKDMQDQLEQFVHIKEMLHGVDINAITPIEALQMLFEIVKKIQ